MDNSKSYKEFIKYKFHNSKKTYNLHLDKEREEIFLAYYEYHNVLPIYPKPIIINIKDQNDEYQLKLNQKSDLNQFEKINKIKNSMTKKVDEFMTYKKDMVAFSDTDKVRRFLDYEIRDAIKNIIKNSYITNAWCKLYELLITYDFFLASDDIVRTFHVCEHPGAFLYAIKDYLAQNFPSKNHEFVFQSLKPTASNEQIFKAEKKLFEKFKHNLDYGKTGTGDITDISNILYYKEKYKHLNFDLITSDCGLDCSDDFNLQENTLLPIFFGAFLTAIALSNKGTCYICKMFTFYSHKTLELLYLFCIFFKSVDIVNLLTTKSGSAEIYVVCKYFIFDKEDKKFNDLFQQLIEYYKKIKTMDLDQNDSLSGKMQNNLVSIFEENFVAKVLNAAVILGMRRIININLLIFRLTNYDYVTNHKTIKKFVKNLVDYYTKYFLDYVRLTSHFEE